MVELKNKNKELDDFQLLLEGPEKEFIDFAKILAPNSKLIDRENKLGDLINQRNLAKKNNTTVINKKEFITECKKYNLIFTRMIEYQGDLDFAYAKSIKNFIEEKKLNVSEYDLKTLCITVYPKKCILNSNEDNFNAGYILPNSGEFYYYRGSEEKNPTLLYKEGDFFHVIHQGNNYKTLFNLMRGFMYRNRLTHILFYIMLFILSILLTVSITSFYDLKSYNNSIIGFIAFMSILFTAVINMAYTENRYEDIYFNYYKDRI